MALTEIFQKGLSELDDEFNNGLMCTIFKDTGNLIVKSEEMVEIPPKDIVDANMVKRGFLKPRMRPKTITVEYKPRAKE